MGEPPGTRLNKELSRT